MKRFTLQSGVTKRYKNTEFVSLMSMLRNVTKKAFQAKIGKT